MKIEVWSDFTCPFCYIGKRHLDEALTRFNYADQVTVEYRSYELLPIKTVSLCHNRHQTLAEKYNVSTERAALMKKDLQRQAFAVGLIYDFNHMKPMNTFDAHRLVKYAFRYQKAHEMVERLLHAYFSEGAQINDHETLIQLAADVGLDTTQVAKFIATDRYEPSVRCDQIEAEQIGIESVPFYVFDEKHAVTGVQSSDVLVDILEQIWVEYEKRQQSTQEHSHKSKTTYCSGEDCSK